jgi:Cu+-exporting ATPase
VLIKSAEALERLEKVDTLVVDKTGTLTEGKPRVVAVVRPGLRPKRRAAAWPPAWSASSEHPLAAAIVAAAKEIGIAREPADFASVTGKGVTGTSAARRSRSATRR